MGYFLVISGHDATLVDVVAGRLIPLADAQSYVAELATSIAAVDGSPSFLWEDGESGTSHDLVCAAEEGVCGGRPIEASALGRLLRSCELHPVAARVWWADNEPDAFRRVPVLDACAEALALIQQRSGKGVGIGFVLHPQ